MTKGRKGIDGIDKVVELFPPGSHKMVERLLKRAADRQARAAGRGVRSAMRTALSGGPRGGQTAAWLAADLGKALRQRSDVGGGKASIRKTAPDTGGRPFHFAHSVVNKGDAPPATPAGKAGKVGRAAAHMRYIERELAVETTDEVVASVEVDGRERDVGRTRDGSRSRDDGSWDRAMSPEAASRVHTTSAAAAQGYVENPAKLANGERIVFSFGTIGDRFEDRVAFWEALENAERHPSARVQNRLIMELPHEASPEARFEMVKTFCSRFVDDGVPFWAALHAPGKDNDSRNFHAHVVFSERPAKRMVDPSDGATRWDFAIISTYRKKSRNTVTTRPYVQSKLRAYTARGFIPTLRKEFSDVVNAVLEREGVKDRGGAEVRYDARSYKAMGVDVVPMRSINRIVADKMRDGTATVLDGDYTRRMIAAELREAASRRQRDVIDLLALDDALRAAAASARPQAENGRLPRELRVSPLAMTSKVALGAAGKKILAARHEALQVDVMERGTVASLDRIVAATAPAAVEAAARKRDPAARLEAPSTEGAALLHAAALEELAATRASTAEARRSIRYRVGSAVNEWRALVRAPTPDTTPSMRATLRAIDERETAAVQAAMAASGRDATARSRQPGGRSADEAPTKAASGTQARGASVDAGARTRAGGGAAVPPAVPKTAADALAIAMPPTTADLAAASKTVSGWIKIIAEGEPDVDKRMARLDAFMIALKEWAASARRGLRGGEGEDLSPAAGRNAPAGGAPRDAKAPDRPEASPGGGMGSTPAPPDRDPGRIGAVEPVAVRRSTARESMVIASSSPELDRRPGTLVPSEEPPEVRPSRQAEPTPPAAVTPGQRARPAEEPEPEHPADAKRRLKREEEEKRRKKRKAVLGRRNRGWAR